MSMLLNNRYRILQTLGSGGFGVTFLAEDTFMPSNRRCVVKQLKPISNDPVVHQLIQERFQREAAILETLGKVNDQIPSLYAFFSEANQFYLVQEFIEGENLKQKFEREGTFGEATVKKLLIDLLPTLGYVHSLNIIHRDIKPANIMLREHDGKPVLIDFGAVKEVTTIINAQGIHSPSIVVGTPGFMAVEQAAGRPVLASDIYSLGWTAICLLTGKAPSDLLDIRTGGAAWYNYAPHVSQRMAGILYKAIAQLAHDRYQSAQEMLEAIGAIDSQLDATTLVVPTAPASAPTDSTLSVGPERRQVAQPTHKSQTPIERKSPSPSPNRIGGVISTIFVLALLGWATFKGKDVLRGWWQTGGMTKKNANVANANGGAQDASKLFPIPRGVKRSDQRSYYIDRTGRVVIEPRFDRVSDFYEGLACVEIGDKWGYIDTSGEIVIEPQFTFASHFSEGVALARKDNSWGYINKSGDYVITPQFNNAYDFSEGVAAVKVGDKWGYIDKYGKYVINPQYSRAWSFVEEVANVEVGGKCGYIDKSGNIVINPQFECRGDPQAYIKLPDFKGGGNSFSEGLRSVKVGDKWGFIDRQGKFAISPRFDEAYNFSEGLAAVGLGRRQDSISPDRYYADKWGYIDKTGKFVIEPKFSSVGNFSDGLAYVYTGGYCGYIDSSGEGVIYPQFPHCSDFNDGLAYPVYVPDPKGTLKLSKFLVINKLGEVVLRGEEGHIILIDVSKRKRAASANNSLE